MSRFSQLSHATWHCQYHIVWVPKYRYRVLKDPVEFELSKSIGAYSERLGCELVELNVQVDHIHLSVKIPPKISISPLMGTLKEKPYRVITFGRRGIVSTQLVLMRK